MKSNFLCFVLLLCFQGICGIIKFKFVRGRQFDRYVGFRTQVPTLYQCAQICQTLNMCNAINFDLLNKICYISTQPWSENSMMVNTNFVFANRDDIPEELGRSCSNKVCGENKICLSGECYPSNQCVDGTTGSPVCLKWSRYGGCDADNIGRNLTNGILWTSENFNYMFSQCKRTCKFCKETV